jgi:hypothetical protein
MDFTLRSVFTANSRLAEMVSEKFAAWPRVIAVLRETSKQAINFSVHEAGGRNSTGIKEILETEDSVAET